MLKHDCRHNAPEDDEMLSVYDYETNEKLAGRPDGDLVSESMDAGWSGAVLASERDGIWSYVRDDDADSLRRHCGVDVHKIYIE